jgi:flagellar hook-associated protein 1 FlgK
MSKISSVMNIAQRSMMNSQTGLQTVSHNIANKNTEGFSRQRVEFVTNTPPTDMGKYQIVRVQKPKRLPESITHI